MPSHSNGSTHNRQTNTAGQKGPYLQVAEGLFVVHSLWGTLSAPSWAVITMTAVLATAVVLVVGMVTNQW